eukprot:2551174-Karenia_brevis.AAC.1
MMMMVVTMMMMAVVVRMVMETMIPVSRSYYSGTLVKDMGKMHVEQALRLRGFDCGVGFINTHSSDMEPVATSWKPTGCKHGPAHVYGLTEDRLTVQARGKVAEHSPADGWHEHLHGVELQEKRLEVIHEYKELARWLKANRSALFNGHTTAACARHQDYCQCSNSMATVAGHSPTPASIHSVSMGITCLGWTLQSKYQLGVAHPSMATLLC